MNTFEAQLNNLLVGAYRSIEEIEEHSLRTHNGMNLTISEIHLIEAVGPKQEGSCGKTVSEISEYLGISLPSVTLAINKLVKKGYVTKQKSASDGRVVYVTLTREGQRAEHAHRYFHRNMVRAITKNMEPDEKEALMNGIIKLNHFFQESLDKSKERT